MAGHPLRHPAPSAPPEGSTMFLVVAQEHSRIDELQQAMLADPASLAFAQLADEYRRAGHHAEAVECCINGLRRHADYLPARITLGRSLLELNRLDDAAQEFLHVLDAAPDHLGALRGMGDVLRRRGAPAAALEFLERAHALARFDTELGETVARLRQDVREQTAREEVADATRPDTPAADFDGLAASLGATDTAAPPVVEHLLSGRPVASVRELLPPVVPSAPGDPFAVLEAELRAFERATAAPDVVNPARTAEPSVSVNTAASASDAEALAALEAWLTALSSEHDREPGD